MTLLPTLTGEFEFEPNRCPMTGIATTATCRCQWCRPDLHWTTVPVVPSVASTPTTVAVAGYTFWSTR